jgi:hypothetical protein
MLFSANTNIDKTPVNTGSLNQLGVGIPRLLKAANCNFEFCFCFVCSFSKTLLNAPSAVFIN